MENILLHNNNGSVQFDTEKINGVVRWTNEQIKYIIDQYLHANISVRAIAKQFDRSETSIRTVLKHNNVKIRSGRLGRNSSYFENIDTRDKAYWLGIMYSDGCVYQRPDGSYAVTLEMIDKEHVEKFRDALNAEHKVSTVHHKHFNNAQLSYVLCIYDNKMAADLIALGCVPKKSLNLSALPNIPREFMYDFIRGFVDGDGCICYNQSSDSYVFKLTGASPLFLKEIMKMLGMDRLSLNQCTKTSYQVTNGKRDDVYRILTKLYEYSTEVTRLDRKYNKYQEFVQWYNIKTSNKGPKKEK